MAPFQAVVEPAENEAATFMGQNLIGGMAGHEVLQ
jgi:hypothetical protein